MKKLRGVQCFWTLFIGIGAFFGGIFMIVEPTGRVMGMDAMLPCFQVLPFAETLFQNFTFSGIALIIVNGVTQMITFVLLLRRNPLASRFGIGCGVILMLWICIQFVIFEFNFMSTAYFIFGALEALTGLLLYVEERRAGR